VALTALPGDWLFGEVFGSGPPWVLALHGWGRRASDFRAALDGLDAVAPDLPGFGGSPAPEAAEGAAGYAQRLHPLLETFEGPAVVVGHSFGGRVAVCLAAQRPESVGALVLVGVPLLRDRPPSRPSLRYRLLRAGHRMGFVPDSSMERARQAVGSTDYATASGVMRQVFVQVVNESYEEELARVAGPVHLLWGADDTEAPPSVAERSGRILEERGVAVKLEVLPEVGHLLPTQAPAELRRVIDSYLP
jgi:pimeloyl-ACP methyl ester carboxylesterase